MQKCVALIFIQTQKKITFDVEFLLSNFGIVWSDDKKESKNTLGDYL